MRKINSITKEEALEILDILEPQLFSSTTKTKNSDFWKFKEYNAGKRLVFVGNDYFLDIDFESQDICVCNEFIGDEFGKVPISLNKSQELIKYVNNKEIYFTWQSQ